ncbi:DUF5703 domain-containing protein [Bacteroidota bacterium]
MKIHQIIYCLLLFIIISFENYSQSNDISPYNIVWNSQSKNSSESMPCGGGDIGLNVWVENGYLLFYISKSGTFDENNGFLKLGRIRLKLIPNPFEGKEFRQELKLKDGSIKINGSNNTLSGEINIWIDVFRPVIHIDISCDTLVNAEAIYESWRYEDRFLIGAESFANSFKWAPLKGLKTLKDEIKFSENDILFYHRNKADSTIFDVTVKQQDMEYVKSEMFNPIKNLTFGGIISGQNMIPNGTVTGKYLDTEFTGWKLKSSSPSDSHKIEIYLHTDQTNTLEDWKDGLNSIVEEAELNKKTALQKTREWWNTYWERSYIFIQGDDPDQNSEIWQVGRNYQLFRYMLGCNAIGDYPTKFNGGLFTYDPRFTDSTRKFTPDYRNWGGGTFTAQNQRLVYFPMIKSGDFEMMKPQFDFYLRSLRNAELRSEVYWGHKGACFTEQLENFGLPNCSEYGWDRPDWYDKGMQYNAWLEYQWDTALEFCLMMLEIERYTGEDISEYIPFIESCLTFFNVHYKYLAKMRGRKAFDQNGDLILYPGSSCETYKMAYNATSTVAALKTILTRLLELPSEYLTEEKRNEWSAMLERIPPINFQEIEGHKTIAPAKLWERVNNTETPQLYPVFPWGIYGIGKPDLEIALNTWNYDPDAIKFRSHVGWKQDNIWAARLGLTKEASELTTMKLKDSGRRFPAFWGPGFDWVPDHNWGGSGMIGLQEMLLQVDGEKIYLFPAWPKSWNVHFKLHAPYNTTVEGIVKNEKIILIKVIPEARKKDLINMF